MIRAQLTAFLNGDKSAFQHMRTCARLIVAVRADNPNHGQALFEIELSKTIVPRVDGGTTEDTLVIELNYETSAWRILRRKRKGK
jgi:hypothetical protein